jgi:hypothetical protein
MAVLPKAEDSRFPTTEGMDGKSKSRCPRFKICYAGDPDSVAIEWLEFV